MLSGLLVFTVHIEVSAPTQCCLDYVYLLCIVKCLHIVLSGLLVFTVRSGVSALT